VDENGKSTPLERTPFSLDDHEIYKLLQNIGTIKVNDQFAKNYLEIRSLIARNSERTFTSVALRQLLSSWEQFKHSAYGKYARNIPAKPSHPKVDALTRLVGNIVKEEIDISSERGFIGKVLIFTTYVGAERSRNIPSDDNCYGTVGILSDKIMEELNQIIGSALKKIGKRKLESTKKRTREKLLHIIDNYGNCLKENERVAIKKTIDWFAGSRIPTLLFHNNKLALNKEARQLRHLLQRICTLDVDHDEYDEEKMHRLNARREMRVQRILDRYSTRKLVARYDGAISPEERDRHLRGFNSPFAPLVLIASSVGQEGIDLQKYCSHVVHYDLEWNPAKLEQREGRVDRRGREAKGPINVYFLICRSTYDERMFHVMVNRYRWHQVLLASHSVLSAIPDKEAEPSSNYVTIKKLCLNLGPK